MTLRGKGGRGGRMALTNGVDDWRWRLALANQRRKLPPKLPKWEERPRLSDSCRLDQPTKYMYTTYPVSDDHSFWAASTKYATYKGGTHMYK